VLFQTGPNRDYFQYFADGTEVTAFEPLLARDRTGSDPDRFLPQMREAGLRVDEDQDEEFRDPGLAPGHADPCARYQAVPGDRPRRTSDR
jgi:hypothetical protein